APVWRSAGRLGGALGQARTRSPVQVAKRVRLGRQGQDRHGEKEQPQGGCATVVSRVEGYARTIRRAANCGVVSEESRERSMTTDVERCAYCGGPFHRSHRSHSEFAKSRC